MAELRFKIDTNYMDELSRELGNRSYSDIVRDALTVMKWAADERKRGRYVLSADPEGNDAHRLVLPALEYAAAIGKVKA